MTTHDAKVLKMVVEAVGSYTPKDSNKNGVRDGGEFGQINVLTGTSVTLRFTLKDQATDVETVVPGLYFTIYDLGTSIDISLQFFFVSNIFPFCEIN